MFLRNSETSPKTHTLTNSAAAYEFHLIAKDKFISVLQMGELGRVTLLTILKFTVKRSETDKRQEGGIQKGEDEQ